MSPDKLAEGYASAVASPVIVRAVVVAPEQAVRAAVEGQTRAPDEIVVLGAGQRVEAGPADWLWLLDGSAIPREDALERLLAVAEDPGDIPAPALLASKVERPDGALDPEYFVVPQVLDRDVAIGAFERRVVSLRVVGGGSLLVGRRFVEGSHLNPFANELEWVARILGDAPGLLVPESVAVRTGVGPGRARRLLGERLRLLLGNAIEPNEKPWFALRLAEDALGHLRRAGA